MTTDITPTGAESLRGVLSRADRLGYATQLVARDPGRIECESCGTSSDPGDVTVDHAHRLEGASDAADMLLVIGASCPACGAQGVATLGFGPNSTRMDNEVLAALDLEGATPFTDAPT